MAKLLLHLSLILLSAVTFYKSEYKCPPSDCTHGFTGEEKQQELQLKTSYLQSKKLCFLDNIMSEVLEKLVFSHYKGTRAGTVNTV